MRAAVERCYTCNHCGRCDDVFASVAFPVLACADCGHEVGPGEAPGACAVCGGTNISFSPAGAAGKGGKAYEEKDGREENKR